MYRFKFISIFLLILASINLCYAQSLADQSSILQKCIDLPDIQQYFPINNEGNPVAVHIMQYPIEIATDININKFGQKPVFMSRHEIYDNNIDAYFLFQSIDILESTAYLVCTFYYDYNSSDQKVLSIDMSFVKKEGYWEVSNSKVTKLK